MSLHHCACHNCHIVVTDDQRYCATCRLLGCAERMELPRAASSEGEPARTTPAQERAL